MIMGYNEKRVYFVGRAGRIRTSASGFGDHHATIIITALNLGGLETPVMPFHHGPMPQLYQNL